MTKEEDCVSCSHYDEENDECTIWSNFVNQGMRDDDCPDFDEKCQCGVMAGTPP